MSNYIIHNGTFYDSDELAHYGVPGMKWGVRRATKQLQRATTGEERDRAVASLNKHRAKIMKKISKLTAKGEKMAREHTKALTKLDPKIAKLERKKHKLTKKAGGMFTSDKKAEKLLQKTKALDLKISGLKAKSDTIKAAVAKNERMTSLFKNGLSDVDSALASAGKKYVNG